MRQVLLTGATGVVGSSLVPLLLQEERARLFLVVRARSPEHLQDRARQLLHFWGLDETDPALETRLCWLQGDVCQPRLGLDERTFERLASEVTHVIHAAGNVKLNQSLDDARASALGAAREVAQLCRLSQSRGSFQKLDYISTVGVAGRMPGMIPERPLHEPRSFRNTYEQAKAEAETYLLEEHEKGLPTTIHRPSMVVGNSETGKVISFQVFYHLCEFLSGRRTEGMIPEVGEAVLDLVPCDFVARAIAIASGDPETAGRVLHLSSGLQSVSLQAVVDGARRAFQSRGWTLPVLRAVTLSEFRAALPQLASQASADQRRVLQTYPYFLAYLGDRQIFDNCQTREFLRMHGCELPDVEQHLPTLLHAYAASKEESSGTAR